MDLTNYPLRIDRGRPPELAQRYARVKTCSSTVWESRCRPEGSRRFWRSVDEFHYQNKGFESYLENRITMLHRLLIAINYFFGKDTFPANLLPEEGQSNA